MRRFLSLFLPTFATDLTARRHRTDRGHTRGPAARGPRRPRACLRSVETRGRQVVARRCATAAAAGVAEGMGLAEARALLPHHEVIVEAEDPVRDGTALRALARFALRFAPKVAFDGADGLRLDVTGCGPLFGGEADLLDAFVRGVTRHGLAARAAVASTAGCAWARARHGPHPREVVPAGAEAAALAALPLRALRLPDEVVEALDEVGVTDAARLLALPRTEVAARFPPLVLLRLDQALGRADEALVAFRPTEVLRVERAFSGPVRSLEGVTEATRRLLGALTERLDALGLGALAVEVTLRRSDAPPVRIVRALSRRTADAGHLFALLRPAIERADLGWGVDAVSIAAPRTGPVLLGGGEAREVEATRLAMLLDALVGRLGPTGLTRVEVVASHVPERAFRQATCLQGTGEGARDAGPRVPVPPAERPSWLFAPPEPAILRAGTPPTLVWRDETSALVAVRGPERIGSAWWEEERGFGEGERAYLTAWTATGRRLWVFRETASGRWFVHGEWA